MYWVRGIGIFFLGLTVVISMIQDVFIGILAMFFFGVFTYFLGS